MKNPTTIKSVAARILLASALFVPGISCGGENKTAVPPSLKEPARGEVNAAVTASRTTALVVAAAKANPAVVTVNTTQTIRRRVLNPFFSPFWQDFFRDFLGPPLQEYEEEIPSMGSGFIIDAEGYVLTAEHVIHGADKIEVILPDNRKFPARWLGSDYENDIAVLKIDGEKLPHVELGDSASLMIGEWAIAIGNPFGTVVGSSTPTVSVGVISALGRKMKNAGQGGIRVYEDLIQTDASINPGNSGGPLIDATGRAIGVNVTIITTSGGSLGMGFAVPINRARETARLIIERRMPATWIGVYPITVTPEVAQAFDLREAEGVLIGDLDENGPAFQANLRRGDVILAVDGKPVNNARAFEEAVGVKRAGATVRLRVRRGNAVMEGDVVTAPRPGP